MDVSYDLVMGIAGALLSLLFSYVPGLRTWYAELGGERERLVMLGLLILSAGTIFALGCFSLLQINLTCDKQGVFQFVSMLLTGIMTNQATFLLTPQPTDVKELKGE